jgi:hypothetical protein
MEGSVHLFYLREDPELQAWRWEITEVVLCQAQD